MYRFEDNEGKSLSKKQWVLGTAESGERLDRNKVKAWRIMAPNIASKVWYSYPSQVLLRGRESTEDSVEAYRHT